MPVWSKRGFLYLDFRFKSVRFRQSTELKDTPKNRELAEDWDTTIRHEIRSGTFDLARHFPHSRKAAKPAKSRTFKDAGNTWLESHKGTWAEWTYRKFRDDLQKRIYPELGSMLISDITPLMLRQCRQKLIERPREDGHGHLRNRTINRIMQPVKAIFFELFADGEISTNPAARLIRLKQKRVAEIDPFSEQEIKVLVNAADKHYRPYIQFLFESGFRPNEVNGLKWSQVNLVTRVISIREGRVLGKDKDPKTEKAIRDVEITPGMLTSLKRQKAISFLRYGYVFVGEKGQPVDVSNFRGRVWEPAIKKAELKYRYPYQARHTFATKHLSKGFNPLWVAKQMGTSPEMIYNHYAVYIQKAWSPGDQNLQSSASNRAKMQRQAID